MSRTKKQQISTEKPAYFLEWEASKVAPEIIEKNVKFLEGNAAYEALLYALGQDARTNSGQLRQKWLYRYNHLWAGGWHCSTLDPLDRFNRSDWGCLKPVEPKEKDGKLIKYEHPPQTPTRAFYLEVGEPQHQAISKFWEVGINGDFWNWVINNPSLPVVITEGAKKAGALLSHGYVAVALPGVNNGYRSIDGGKEKELTPDLQVIAQPGREIIFAFDQDSRFKTQKAVAAATAETGKLFEAEGCRVSVLRWDSAAAKGIDDWIAAHGQEKLHVLIEDRLSLAEYREKTIRKIRKFSQNAHFLDFLREAELDKKLRYNLLTLEVELDGRQFDEPDWFYMWFQDKYSVEVSEKIFFQAILFFAYNNKYHPVRDYLESVADLPPVDLDNAAARYFGLTDPISNAILKRWLIGAVARVNRPGCKLQGALILYGKGGRGKSTFFENLGGAFYGGDVDDIKGKDNLLKQHSYWIIECQEFDQITSKTQANALKGWITTDVDNIRPPYGRKASPHKRGFAIGGSVNGIEFLSDPTGSRRFWILDVGNKFVNNELLEAERDNLWAAAVQAYNAGERWHLTAAEEAQISEGNKRYEVSDEWSAIVESYIDHRNAVTVLEVLTKALGFNEKDITRKETLRITNILTALDWGKIGQRREIEDGQVRRGRWWVRGEIMDAMEAGKVSPQATISEIKDLSIDDLFSAPDSTPPDSLSPLTQPPQSSMSRLEALQEEKNETLTHTTHSIEPKTQKQETPPDTESKPDPRIDEAIELAAQEGINLSREEAIAFIEAHERWLADPWRKGRINQINSSARLLGWDSEQLKSYSLERFGKSSFLQFLDPEISQLQDELYRLLPEQ